jgi:hypothetical protein
MNTPGRPFRLDEQQSSEICDLVAAGHSIRSVARMVGCDVKTIRRHAARDQQFARLLAAAELSARQDPLKMMRRATGASWRAAAWMLERTDPDRYGKQRPVGCRPQDLDRTFTRIMDVALGLVRGEQERRAMYLALAKVMEEETVQLFLPPSVRRASSTSDFTFHVDSQRFQDMLDSAARPAELPETPKSSTQSRDKVPTRPVPGPKTQSPKTPLNPERNHKPRC